MPVPPPTPLPATWDELAQGVRKLDGVYWIKAATLRSIAGYERLGKHIITEIQMQLEERDLLTIPAKLTTGDYPVILVARESLAGLLLFRLGEDAASAELEGTLYRINAMPSSDEFIGKGEVVEALEPLRRLLRTLED